MCVKAWSALQKKVPFDPDDIEVVIVATQNSDIRMPHGAAYVHRKLGLKPSCATFDISLGCSGFVYGLSVITSFMKQNRMTKGVLLTSDPYSKMVDPEDRNTTLLFGDAAAASLISENAELVPGRLMVRTVIKDLGVDEDRAPFDIRDYGNTILTFIPILVIRTIRPYTYAACKYG